MREGRSATAIVAAAIAGLAIATYLAVTELGGGLPVCGPVQGCRTVATSVYADLAGLPLAVLGVGFSVAIGSLGAVGAAPPGDRRWSPCTDSASSACCPSGS